MVFKGNQYDINHPGVVSAIDDLPFWSAPFGLKLLDVVRIGTNMRALDVGSGLGFPVLELAQRLGPTAKVFGVDPWALANERARQKIKAWGMPQVQILEGNAESLPFDDHYFDLVTSNNGMNNVDDEEKAFREISRVAKPGAQIALTMNLPDTMHEFYDVYKEVLQTTGKHEELKRLAEHIHHKRKPLPHTQKLVQRVGLDILHIYEESFKFRYSNGTAMLNSPMIKLAFLEPWTSVLEPGDVDSVFRDIEVKLNRIAEVSGEFQLTIPWVCLDIRKN